MNNETECCGTCKYSKRTSQGNFICTNPDSDGYQFETCYTDTCGEWEEKE